MQILIKNTLKASSPTIAAQWYQPFNGEITPDDVGATSKQRFWWKCDKGPDHIWYVPIVERTSGKGCPFCANIRASVTNNLTSLNPDIAEQWHPTRNGFSLPEKIVASSAEKYWWKCPVANDHVWLTEVRSRTRKDKPTGCLYCVGHLASSTNNLTLCPEVAKQWHPTMNGTIKPEDVTLGSGIDYWWKCDVAEDHVWKTSAGSRVNLKSGCPCCAHMQVSTTNSLAMAAPDVAAQWYQPFNGNITPAQVIAGTHEKYWWKCEKGSDHIWYAQVGSLTGKHRTNGCPYCRGLRVSTTNSLAMVAPDVAAQWYQPFNGNITPAQVIAGTHEKYWWKCPVADDHVWRTAIYKRTLESDPRGCPYCRGTLTSSTNNLTLLPQIAKQWHPTMNGAIKPRDVTKSGSVKYWWQCDIDDDHIWHAQMNNRSKGSTCPDCKLGLHSAQEIKLAYELSALIEFDIRKHKIRLGGKLRDVDVILDALGVIVEYDGAWWHKDRLDDDQRKTALIEDSDWKIIRVREEPLVSIHINDVMVATNPSIKTVVDHVLSRIVEVTSAELPNLSEYLKSNQPWREPEAIADIRQRLIDREKRNTKNHQ